MKKNIIIGIIIVIILVIIMMFSKYLNRNKIAFKEVDFNIVESDSNKKSVSTPEELIEALEDSNINIIEIVNDLDLGYNNIHVESKYIKEHNKPLTHPILKETGVSNLMIENKENLLIYSKNGSKLLHVNIRIINSNNIKIENIKMSELWEWDEETKAEYDRNDWDYITIMSSNNVIISHCEFSKSYDGITDIRDSKNITIEYCKVDITKIEDDEFFKRQFEELDNNIDKYPMYKYLRKEVGLSKEKIIKLSSYQFKLYLINNGKNIVIHDNIYVNVKTRIPLARNSSVYLYNIYADFSNINYDIISKRNLNQLKNKYPKLVALSTYGPISLDKSYVVVSDSIFKNVKHKYKIMQKLDFNSIGKIIIKNDKEKLKVLKEKLENIVGVKNYEK